MAIPRIESPHGKIARVFDPWYRHAIRGDLLPKQQPVDFAIWQAADGTRQIWSCIRHTNCGGNTRLFHRWKGQTTTNRDFPPDLASAGWTAS